MAGKTSLAGSLREAIDRAASGRWYRRWLPWILGATDGNVVVLRTKQRLLENYRYGPGLSRRNRLQELGEVLDREQGGRWVAEGAVRVAGASWPLRVLIIDAIRINPQITHLRNAFPDACFLHVHLTAPMKTLAARYASKQPDDETELPSYDEVRKNETEGRVDSLRDAADIVLDTSVVCLPQATRKVLRRMTMRRVRISLWRATGVTARALVLPGIVGAALFAVAALTIWIGIAGGHRADVVLAIVAGLFFIATAGYALAPSREDS